MKRPRRVPTWVAVCLYFLHSLGWLALGFALGWLAQKAKPTRSVHDRLRKIRLRK